ncbi:MAG: hypothetical protein ACOYJY_06120 [Acutalibacteraceae bacterium]|jgi:hypothetical protein
MKKPYIVPDAELDRFAFADVLTTSPDPIGSGDGADDTLDD